MYFDFKIIKIKQRIASLKQQLTATDYMSHKYADKALTDKDYEPIRLQRQAWRDEINRLESQINEHSGGEIK